MCKSFCDVCKNSSSWPTFITSNITTIINHNYIFLCIFFSSPHWGCPSHLNRRHWYIQIHIWYDNFIITHSFYILMHQQPHSSFITFHNHSLLSHPLLIYSLLLFFRATLSSSYCIVVGSRMIELVSTDIASVLLIYRVLRDQIIWEAWLNWHWLFAWFCEGPRERCLKWASSSMLGQV